MSDRYYGEVVFPVWAVKYIPGLKDDSGLESLADSKIMSFAEDEARCVFRGIVGTHSV